MIGGRSSGMERLRRESALRSICMLFLVGREESVDMSFFVLGFIDFLGLGVVPWQQCLLRTYWTTLYLTKFTLLSVALCC